MAENMTFLAAIKKHLTLPGETNADILAGIKKLTPQDKLDLTAMFSAIGISITAPSAAA